MIDRSNLPDRVNRSAHPIWLLVISVLQLLAFALWLFFDSLDCTRQEILMSALVGLCIGLPAHLLVKRTLRRNIDFYAELYLASVSVISSRPNSNIVRGLPPIIGGMALFAVTGIERLPIVPAISVYVTLLLLWYPEQKRIYLTAKEKLAAYKAEAVSN